MTLKPISAAIMLAAAASAWAVPASFKTQGMNVDIEFYSPTIVRVTKTLPGVANNQPSFAVIKTPDKVAVKRSDRGNGVVSLASDSVRVDINTLTGAIDFFNANGMELLKNKDYGTSFTPFRDGRFDRHKVRESFLLTPEEPIYGIGQVLDGAFNRRGQQHHLQNENTFTYSPYFMSPTKGYAVYFDNYSISDFNDNRQDLSYEAIGDASDYYFLYGPTPDGIIADVRELTGDTPMLPLWAYGFFQSRERYSTQQESIDVLKTFRKQGVPIDVMIQDWRYWPEWHGTDSTWNGHCFDPQRFPDPKGWADAIHALNGKLMIVTWPGTGPLTPHFKAQAAKGHIINFDTFPPNHGVRVYDVYSPESRDIFWNSLDKGVFSVLDNDGWWLDSTEPDHNNVKFDDFFHVTEAGTFQSVKNAFSMMQSKNINEHQRAKRDDKRVVILTRSGFIGQQRYGSNTWSGDVQSTWEELQRQIPAALNFTIMGIPHWNSDTGGFWGGPWKNKGGFDNPEWGEFYNRWLQFSTFCPMMRSHGTGIVREIYNFGKEGDPVYDAQKRMLKLRYRMLPYNYSLSWDVSANDGTFMRPLFMDFGADANTYKVGNQYMWGRNILVTPVTQYQAKTWPVYLPAGTKWYDFWTNETVDGGRTVDKEVELDMLPLYVKAGTVMPFGPDVQYSTEKPWNNLEIRVYPGADGSFTLYEDEFDNYNYEKGAYTTIPFNWDEKNRTLTIGKRSGEYKGMIKNRKFRIAVMDSSKAKSGDMQQTAVKTVSYSGKPVTVKL